MKRLNTRTAFEACGYRSPTWQILRALKSINASTVVSGKSAAAPFFESAGRPSKPVWGPQQGNKFVLWESLTEGEKEECLKVLQKEAGWVIWCKANPSKKDKRELRGTGVPGT
jgi:hypothetical protein